MQHELIFTKAVLLTRLSSNKTWVFVFMLIKSKQYFFTFLSLTLLFVLNFTTAKAEIFTWFNKETGVNISYPDTWQVAHNQKPDDLITLQAPGERDYASCRIRKRDDDRILIYPSDYERDLQHFFIGFDFWSNYVGEYSGTILHRIQSSRGFVNTIAGSAEYTFISSAGPKTLMRGIAFAGYDSGDVYIFECSAEYGSYDRWHPVFQSILKSAYKPIYEPLIPSGNYRPFLSDKALIIKGKTFLDDFE